MIEDSIKQFRLNMLSVRNLHSIVSSMAQLTPNTNTKEVLRAEIVLSVSAFDCFMHDLIRLATLEIYSGSRQYNHSTTEKPKFESNKLIFLLTKSKDAQLRELDAEFRRIYSTKTFQDPSVIQDNLLAINISNIWQHVSNGIQIPKSDIEQKLGLIISRRHVIVHEADINHQGALGEKNQIDEADVLEDISFIEAVCEEIYRIACRTGIL